jgi:hypothetical protein
MSSQKTEQLVAESRPHTHRPKSNRHEEAHYLRQTTSNLSLGIYGARPRSAGGGSRCRLVWCPGQSQLTSWMIIAGGMSCGLRPRSSK